MTQEQYQVTEFMKLFGQAVLTKPTIPSLEIRKLRAKLIMEEALETIQALGFRISQASSSKAELVLLPWKSVPGQGPRTIEPNLVKIADGLADLHYVGYCGTAVACGIDMEPVFEEVHRSNMSKMWTEEDLKLQKELHPSGIVEKYGNSLYHILVDGKVTKSPSYSPANVAAVLAKQAARR